MVIGVKISGGIRGFLGAIKTAYLFMGYYCGMIFLNDAQLQRKINMVGILAVFTSIAFFVLALLIGSFIAPCVL